MGRINKITLVAALVFALSGIVQLFTVKTAAADGLPFGTITVAKDSLSGIEVRCSASSTAWSYVAPGEDSLSVCRRKGHMDTDKFRLISSAHKGSVIRACSLISKTWWVTTTSWQDISGYPCMYAIRTFYK